MSNNLILRQDKQSPLTHEELDGNLSYLKEYITQEIERVVKTKMGADNFLHIQDQKPQDAHGGTFTSGDWRTRDLNTVLTNTIDGASLSNNQITLPAGKYYVEAKTCNHSSSDLSSGYQTRVYNATILSVVGLGMSRFLNFTASNVSGTIEDSVFSQFQLQYQNVIELQQKSSDDNAVYGFGRAAGIGTEVYSDIRIWRIGDYVAP